MSEIQALFELEQQTPINANFELEENSGIDAVFEMKVDFTITVGDTETLPASEPAYVENVGTPTDIVLNFGIPQGQQGVQGPQGPVGPAGQDAKIIIRRL